MRQISPNFDTCVLENSAEDNIHSESENEINMYVENISSKVPFLDTRLKSIKEETKTDTDMQRVKTLTKNGWPESKRDAPKGLKKTYQCTK